MASWGSSIDKRLLGGLKYKKGLLDAFCRHSIDRKKLGSHKKGYWDIFSLHDVLKEAGKNKAKCMQTCVFCQ